MSIHSTNTDILFLVFAAVFLIVLSIALYKKYSGLRKPHKSSVSLPEKIHFQQQTDNEYGYRTFAMDIFTLGGHGRLKEAKYHYERDYSVYAQHFNKSIDLHESINTLLNDIGQATYEIMKELERSRKILKQPTQGSEKNRISKDYSLLSLKCNQLSEVSNYINTNGQVFLGASIGGLAALGSWTLVSLVGTASTGTAIATLSGAAAHNATLAWFGGGALAAGGGGMAAGTVTLGVIFLAPVVILSAYKTHSSATELEDKRKEVLKATSDIQSQNDELYEIKSLIRDKLEYLSEQCQLIKSINDQTSKLLYPKGSFSKARRKFDSLFKDDFYSKDEAEAIDRLIRTFYLVEQNFSNQASQKLSIEFLE